MSSTGATIQLVSRSSKNDIIDGCTPGGGIDCTPGHGFWGSLSSPSLREEDDDEEAARSGS